MPLTDRYLQVRFCLKVGICIFLRLMYLSFTNQFSKKQHRLASTAFSVRKGAKIQNRSPWLCHFFFQNLKLKYIFVIKIMNSRSKMTEVLCSDFPCLRSLCSLIDLSSLCNLTSLSSLYSPISSKNFLIMMVWLSMASKWPIPNLLCGMDHQKSKFLLIYGTFSVRGCWCQPMLLFQKLVDETQISKSQEYTDTLGRF